MSKADWGASKPYVRMPPRLIWRSFGAEKSGKDHFGLTGPGPYAKHLFDPGGLEGVADKFDKDIHIFTYKRVDKRVFKNASREHIKRAWDEAKVQREAFLENLELSIRLARTISIDESECWEMFRFAEFGEASEAPKNYDVLNADYRDMVQSAVDSRVNFQLIQKMKEKWGTTDEIKRDENGMTRTVKKPYATGEMIPTGFKELGYLTQANFFHTWSKENGFGIEVLNCRQNMGLAGETFYNMSMPELAQLVFPDSGEQDWE